MGAHPAGGALRRGAAPAVPAGRSSSSERTPVRLTARGRRLVAALGLAAGVGAAALAGSVLRGGESPSGLHLAGQSSVVVRPGDTLWSIASAVAGEDDVRQVVVRLEQVNGLRSTTLEPGEVLRLP
jgi:nucleoid-associated protein YgaU